MAQTLIPYFLIRGGDSDIAVDSADRVRSRADLSFIFTVFALTYLTYSTPPYLGWRTVRSRHADGSPLRVLKTVQCGTSLNE